MFRTPKILGRVAAVAILLFAGQWSFEQYSRIGSWDLAFLKTFPIIVLAILSAAGAVCVGFGWPARSGNEECCASCGHAWVPDDHMLLNHCQECGACWRWFDGRTAGSVQSRPGIVALGIVLLACTPMAIVAEGTGAFSLLNAKPRWMLLKSVQSALPRDAIQDWRVLRTQAQSDPALRQDLADAITQRRARSLALPAEFTNWMHNGVVTATLPKDAIERWLGQMLEFRVDVAALAQAEDIIPFTVTAKFLGGWEGVADVPQVVIGGFSIGDDPTPAYVSPYPIPGSSLTSWTKVSSGELAAPKDSGPVKVAFRGWLIIGQPVNTVAFDASGAPIAPPGSIVREYTWTRTVEVFDDRPKLPPQGR